MIDPHNIIQFQTVRDSPDPPLVACLFVIFPVIERIAPKLSRCGKCIRRTPGNSEGIVVFIKLEQFRGRPRIRTVKSHINRNISDDLNSLFIGVCMEFFPLSVKLILLEFIKSNLLCQLFFRGCQRSLISGSERCFPLFPADAAVSVLYRHVQTVIVQPVRIFLCKCLIILIFPEPFKRFFQRFKTGFVDFFIIDTLLLISEIICLALLFCQKSFFDQCFQVNVIRVAGICGERLVWGIPITSRPKRQNLPVALSRFFQQVNKSVSFF